MSRVSTILITHEPAEAVARMLAYWAERDPDSQRVVAYGGPASEFERIAWPAKALVEDPALRTRDHPRERQSYQGVFRAVLPVLEEQDCGMVHLAEYDEVPVVGGLGSRLAGLLEAENADVLGHGLRRVDESSNPHWLHHVGDRWFGDYWPSISRREDQGAILSMLGCDSFWTLEAFREVAALEAPGRIYLELFLPTAAHHLGFRVRPLGDQLRFMHPDVEKRAADFARLREQGAWTVHPVKGMWLGQPTEASP